MARRKNVKYYLDKLPERYRVWLELKDTYGLNTRQCVCAYHLPYSAIALAQIFQSWKNQETPPDPGKWLEEKYQKKINSKLPSPKQEFHTLLIEQWKGTFNGRPKTGKTRLRTPSKQK